jgi:hypothetical protein
VFQGNVAHFTRAGNPEILANKTREYFQYSDVSTIYVVVSLPGNHAMKALERSFSDFFIPQTAIGHLSDIAQTASS